MGQVHEELGEAWEGAVRKDWGNLKPSLELSISRYSRGRPVHTHAIERVLTTRPCAADASRLVYMARLHGVTPGNRNLIMRHNRLGWLNRQRSQLLLGRCSVRISHIVTENFHGFP
jgi:hypothetical protein